MRLFVDRPLALLVALMVALLFMATPARSASPPPYGGVLRLPLMGSITRPDPIHLPTPLAASIAASVFDTLYRCDPRGGVEPILALELPEREGRRVTIRLRPGLRRHDRRPLLAADVAASLLRASRSPEAGWLLADLARRGGQAEIRALDSSSLELRLSRSELDIARILCALPLAIVAGAQRGAGTGPYAARASASELRLREHRSAPRGAPYLRELRLVPVANREAELRAFELDQLDGSWHGSSVYGRARTRVTQTRLFPASPILLVAGSRGGLGDPATLAALAQAIDPHRLVALGIVPSRALGAGLPPPSLGPAHPPASPRSLSLLIRAGDPFEARVAEGLVGILDEAGFRLRIERLEEARYAQSRREGRWDLRLATVIPPLPGRSALLAAACMQA